MKITFDKERYEVPITPRFRGDFNVIFRNEVVEGEEAQLPLSQQIFKIVFEDVYGNSYQAYFDGVNRVNNKVYGEAVQVIFENYNLEPSTGSSKQKPLKYRYYTRVPNPAYADGYEDRIACYGDTPIYLVVAGVGDVCSCEDVVATIQDPVKVYRGLSSFEIWRLDNPEGTMQDYDDWQRAASVDAARKTLETEKKVSQAEEIRIRNEEQRQVAYDKMQSATADSTTATTAATAATTAATAATTAAKSATTDTIAATTAAKSATTDTIAATTAAKSATTETIAATTAAQNATAAANAATSAANTATGKADAATASATSAAAEATNKAGLASQSAGNANAQALRAKNLADNPPIIRNGYWWAYDEDGGDYVSTGVVANGMYPTFSIDTATMQLSMAVPEGFSGGDFQLINGRLNFIL